MPAFTPEHLPTLRRHVTAEGQTRRITHNDVMNRFEQDCCELGLLWAVSWTTSISPAGVALLQAVDAIEAGS